MSALLDSLEYFHFLRPAWLALLLPLAWTWWRMHRLSRAAESAPAGIAPHLVKALTAGRGGLSRWRALDGLALIGLLMITATAGPTWSKVPNPLVAQTSPLAMVLAVTESMDNTDVAPSRLERARQKLLDLSQLRSGARTSLIAYAGTAHRVVPLTEDPQVLKPFIEGLSTDIMPEPGANATAALALANESLAGEAVAGAIVFVLDRLERADIPAFEEHARQEGPRMIFLTLGSTPEDLQVLDNIADARVIKLTPDDADVRQVERYAAQAYRKALAGDDSLQWRDRGGLLAWPAALLTLLYFRRGWVMHWPATAGLVLLLSAPDTVKAEGLLDWVLTPDQQARLIYEDRNFSEAADRFQDPLWKGYALYQAGRYPEAVAALDRLATSEAAFIQGMAQTRALNYRAGIEAFKLALERDPDNRAAARNLSIARALLAYVEDVRAAEDTGSGSEGADAVVYDKEAEGGEDVLASDLPTDGPTMLSAEQWMRSVDTRASDFLQQRFLLEASEVSR